MCQEKGVDDSFRRELEIVGVLPALISNAIVLEFVTRNQVSFFAGSLKAVSFSRGSRAIFRSLIHKKN